MRLVSPGALAEPQSVAAACGWSAGVRGAWKTRLQIGISGSYGGMNLGDEAILEGILGQLRATISADVTVFSRNPNDILARHEVERAICPRSLTRREMIPEIQKLDLLILGGGGLLYDRHAEEYLREVFIANELAIPVMLYAISAGPLTTQASRQAVQRALNVSPSPVITVRDRLGYRLLVDIIFAALHGTPFAALPYASKVTGLLEDLDMETPPLGTIGIGQLIARIDRSWDRRGEVREKIRQRLPEMKARAKRTNELLLGLLADRPQKPPVP